MILLTTSHRPTRRIRSLCNDLTRSIPNSVRVNRGKMNFFDVAAKAIELGTNKFVVVDRWKGGPGRIRFFKVMDEEIKEIVPRLYVSGVKLRREFGVSREEVRRVFRKVFLDVDEMGDEEIGKLASKLSEFFELPALKKSEARTLKYEAYLRIAKGEDCWAYLSFHILPSNMEVGPRIKISHVVWQV